MKRKLISILLACILALGISMPVLADDGEGKALKIGDKVALESGHEATYLGKVDGKEQWQADFGSLQYIPGTQTPIDCQWEEIKSNEWVANANIFTATTSNGKVTVEYQDKKMHWQPNLKVDGKTQDEGDATLLFFDPINSNWDYLHNTLQWDYGNGITRNVRLIEGMLIEYYTISELPAGDIELKTNVNKDIGFEWARPVSVWDADNNPVKATITGHDVTIALADMQEAILPITIDPDTTFTTSSSDGYQIKYWTDYATAHDAAEAGFTTDAYPTTGIGQYHSAALTRYYVLRGYVYFDTSALPDGATISAAVLKLYGQSDNSDTDFNIQVQIGSGTPPTYPHDPLVKGDYLYTQYSGDGGKFDTAGFSTIAYNSLTLSAAGRGWISKTGATKFALLSDEDIADSPPANNDKEQVYVYSYEQGAGYRPQLVVTYAASASPSVTTNAATYVAKYTARLNSTLDDDGGEPCDIRFDYYEDGGAWGDAYTDWVDNTYLTGNTPWVDVDGLTHTTLHHYRVQARNDFGGGAIISGASVDFTTEAAVAVCANFKAYPASTTVGLTWTKGVGATTTLIRYSEVDYPADETEGILAYNGTLSSYTITGLTAGHTYYIVAIGNSGVDYSATVEVMASTTAASTALAEPGAPETPTGFFQEPDPSGLVNFPGYSTLNTIAGNLGVSTDIMWTVIVLAFIGIAGFIFYAISHSMMIVMVVIAIGISWGSLVGVLPLWMMFLAVILGLGLFGLQRRGA